ncbi:MarR family transcriptional regulator [Kutzneria viridogrisea]|uniref:HTH marR-type domain-containing protein n=2 Tax=Kutzneria TaxID=43356 RepID=W5WQ61_9PSEU
MQSPTGVGFLLSQMGVFVSDGFAERVAALGLTPPQVGVLRLISQTPGLSQQALADRLGILPSRMVGLVDDLEARGLVERSRNPQDRRLYALHPTERGWETLASVSVIAVEFEREVCAPLSEREAGVLTDLLRRLADGHELPVGVHLGYRHLTEGDAG